MSAIATGAERVYLPEEGIRYARPEIDLGNTERNFRQGIRQKA